VDRRAAGTDWSEIRHAKYRGLLRVAARDLGGRPFAQSLEELSALADRCLDAGLACAADETGVELPALFALGKLGGRELNFSSDVDLLFLYHPPSGVDPLEHNEAVGRLVRHLKGQFETPSGDGFAYRVDLNLRPEGRTGVLANSIDAALGYYESFGAEWERQMLLRLRLVAGPAGAAADFSQGIIPFVYRRHIDPGVMQNVRDMKARIEEERRRAGRDIDADVKEGPGGIRDVEFLVQSFQLFYGGRNRELRIGNVLEALEVMGRRGLLPEATVSALANAYLWLRRAEHALQLTEEQQTARFPHERAAQTALARRMGYQQAPAAEAHTRLLDDWTWVRSEVRTHFEALVLSDQA
jgi:glutamate-ammonia-ligase adenylyltransferase